jgi:ERO1-like protein alpha
MHAGIATSLKILFSEDDCGGVPSAEPQLQLERNEVIALFNLMERLSHSVEAIKRLSQKVADGVVSEPVASPAAFGQPAGLSAFLS